MAAQALYVAERALYVAAQHPPDYMDWKWIISKQPLGESSSIFLGTIFLSGQYLGGQKNLGTTIFWDKNIH